MFASSLAGICLLFELLSLKYKALFTRAIRFVLLTLFLGACVASYYSGFYGADFATKLSPELVKEHQGYARFGLIILLAEYFLGAIVLVTENSTVALVWIYRGLLVLTAGVIIYTSHLGGQLVFEHGGGVRTLGYVADQEL